jgi:hypothetical protein
MNSSRKTFLGLIVLLALAASAFAGTGKIAGTVLDTNGDAVIGANVMVVESQRGVTVLDPNGNYAILGLDPGTYSRTGNERRLTALSSFKAWTWARTASYDYDQRDP